MTTNYCGSTSYLLHIYILMVPRVSNPTVQIPLTRAVSLAIYYDAGTIIPQGRRLTPTGLNVFLHQVGMEGLEPSRLAAPDP